MGDAGPSEPISKLVHSYVFVALIRGTVHRTLSDFSSRQGKQDLSGVSEQLVIPFIYVGLLPLERTIGGHVSGLFRATPPYNMLRLGAQDSAWSCGNLTCPMIVAGVSLNYQQGVTTQIPDPTLGLKSRPVLDPTSIARRITDSQGKRRFCRIAAPKFGL